MKKQTAVEWLVEQIKSDSDIIFCYDKNVHPFDKYVETAKAMEKEQKIEKYFKGVKKGKKLLF
jgi:hypothetical protein